MVNRVTVPVAVSQWEAATGDRDLSIDLDRPLAAIAVTLRLRLSTVF